MYQHYNKTFKNNPFKKKKKKKKETAQFCGKVSNSVNGRVSSTMDVANYTNDYRIKEVKVMVEMESDGCGKKSIYLRKSNTMVLLAKNYTDLRNTIYAMQFESGDNVDGTSVLKSISGSNNNFVYTSYQNLSQFVSMFVSGTYEFVVETTEVYASVHVLEWCVELTYYTVPRIETTYLVNMTISSNEYTQHSEERCEPFSVTLYDINSSVINSTVVSPSLVTNITCRHLFLNGALDACVQFISF
ncbi:hypothetical protein RFI_23100, partial [Reticulomyxa filosa]